MVQPHRFTRLQSLFEEFCTCFNDADTVVVAEVYPAGEAPIPGIDRDHFVLGLRAHGHREVIPLQNSADLAGVIRGLASRGDLVVCLGAGNITQWAYALPGELKALGKGDLSRHHARSQSRDAAAARAAAGEPVARGADLVSGRRPGAGAVHAIG